MIIRGLVHIDAAISVQFCVCFEGETARLGGEPFVEKGWRKVCV
jgi:hypothetical protein